MGVGELGFCQNGIVEVKESCDRKVNELRWKL